MKSTTRTHPAPPADSTSHFLSAIVQGREGGVRGGEREGGVAVVGGRTLLLGNSSPAPSVSLSPGCWLSRRGGMEGMRPAAWERSEYDTVRAKEEGREEGT